MVFYFLKIEAELALCVFTTLTFSINFPPLHASKYFCVIPSPTHTASVVLTKHPPITTKQPVGLHGVKSQHWLQNNSLDFRGGNLDIVQLCYYFGAAEKTLSEHHPGPHSWGLDLGLPRKVPPFTVLNKVGSCTQWCLYPKYIQLLCIWGISRLSCMYVQPVM